MSELRAIKPVSTAFQKTKKILFDPFDGWLWLKLVIIMFFVGSGGGNSFNPGNILQYTMDDSGETTLPDFSQWLSDPVVIAIILTIVILLVAIVLLFMYLKAVFSFVLIESLTSGNVRIIQPFVDNMSRGFKAFLFNLGLTLISLAGLLILIGVILVSVFFIMRADSGAGSIIGILLAVGLLLLAILVFILFSMIIGLVIGFFYDFAVPLMYFKGMGLRASLGHLAGLIKREPVEFLVYIVLRWILTAAVGFLFLIIYLCVLGVFIAAGIVLVLLAALLYEVSVWLLVPIALVFVAGLILLILIMAIISLPIAVYFRYYSLDFLRSFDPSYVKYAGRFGGEPAGLLGQGQ